MADSGPLFIHPFAPHEAPLRSRYAANVELADRQASVAGPDTFHAQARRRRNNDRAIIQNPLAHLTDEDLAKDVTRFAEVYLPEVRIEDLVRAARVAKDIRTYDEVARSTNPDAGRDLPVQLNDDEKHALKSEKDSVLPAKDMLIVILTVSLAAFLQGHVQSSINGSVPYLDCIFNTPIENGQCADRFTSEAQLHGHNATGFGDFKLGAVNASPFLFAAALGCPLAVPVNDVFGRKGAMVLAALLIFASSLASAFVKHWHELFIVRIVNGIGMGLKAVSTPILASETSVGFWRGSSILAWQLWVAFGIMIGFAVNLIFLSAQDRALTGKLILGAPFVPALMLLIGLYFCPESPRYYMRLGSPSYNPAKAYEILKRLRKTDLQALRDLYLVYKSIEQEEASHGGKRENRLIGYFRQFKQLLVLKRSRNALISSGAVNLAQQLCGINILAFYSTTLFINTNDTNSKDNSLPKTAMGLSLGFGAINFFFGLPAIRTIDTLGRRKWLTITLPPMTIFMAAAAASSASDNSGVKKVGTAFWLLVFAAAYSPGLGPIPFTLASESFPLSNREAGCAFSIAINLLFAGILSLTFPPLLNGKNRTAGALGTFAGLNFVAFLLVFTLVEETKRRSLEDLDLVFAVSKGKHVRYQLFEYLPWFVRYYFLGRHNEPKPSLYLDEIWGSVDRGNPDHLPPSEEERVMQPVRGDGAGKTREEEVETIDSDHR